MIWVVSLLTTKLSPRRLTHARLCVAFVVCLGLVTSTWPLAHSVLYLHIIYYVAVPQYISGRTSYFHVRLAFHPYPQVLPQFCITGGFEPRRTVTFASLCPWIAHVVSGRITTTSRLFSEAELVAFATAGEYSRLLAERALSNEAITPGTPSLDDVAWWMRERLLDNHLESAFGTPSVYVLGPDRGHPVSNGHIIEPGELLAIDSGVNIKACTRT